MDKRRLTSLDDPRVAAYRNLPDRTLRGEAMFVAEGLVLVRRLLASRCQVESLLVTDEYAKEFTAIAPPGVPVYVADEPLAPAIVGFPFHRGALAVGKRPAAESLASALAPQTARDRLRWVVYPEIAKPENMGSFCAARWR